MDTIEELLNNSHEKIIAFDLDLTLSKGD